MEDTLRVMQIKLNTTNPEVLILVLMEDTLRDKIFFRKRKKHIKVLILVLMEDTLRDAKRILAKKLAKRVLILVLMEDTLRGVQLL